MNRADYPHIGEPPERLVVFFSRMGYVRKQAYEEAERTGAAVYEIKATERTEGTVGFWWCGRFGMHRWEMPIEPISVNLTAYRHVTILSPIWVFSLSAPVRSFCRAAAGKLREADYNTAPPHDRPLRERGAGDGRPARYHAHRVPHHTMPDGNPTRNPSQDVGSTTRRRRPGK